MTRDDIVGEALNNFARKSASLSPDGSTTLGTRAVTWLNEVILRRVARAVDGGPDGVSPFGFFFSELNKISTLNTGANTARYGLPSALREIYDIRILDGSNSRKLQYIPQLFKDRLYADPTNWPATQRPRFYTRYGFQIELLPIPDATYSMEMRWSSWATTLSAATSTSDFREKDDLLIAGVTAEAFGAFQEYEEDGKEWFAKFQLLLREAITADPQDWDWQPQAIGHQSLPAYSLNEPWKDPFVQSTSGGF